MATSARESKRTSKGDDTSSLHPDFRAVVVAFAKRRGVTHGLMMASYGLKVNGKIFVMYGGDRFVAKLPKLRVDELVSAGTGKRFDPGHGRLMKEWVSLADPEADWVGLAKEAYAFVKRGTGHG